ncbi:hypothetical protein ACFYOG_03850 [Streptomyces sp. NPDC007818]|uniref:hypothetical protein n=1 Tax=Streptomyces sp. NPDC007818 TaxID=3364780 RepID=UPI0036D19954
MFEFWKAVPDNERHHWALDPFVSVGPLRFGMSPAEVSDALSEVTEELQGLWRSYPASDACAPVIDKGDYREFGLLLHYGDEKLKGVEVDALRGPQVHAEGVALVGRVPSALEQWMIERAKTREPEVDLTYMDAGMPGSDSLGVVLNVQRAGDHLVTRPVFFPSEGLDDLSHFLPRETWAIHH